MFERSVPILHSLYNHNTNIMKLTKNAIKSLNRPARLSLALALGFSEQWINALVESNKDNGPLTTAKALQVIREELNLTDAEVLEESEVKEKTI